MTVSSSISDSELLAWLDEDLDTERMTEIELALRASEELKSRLIVLIQERDHGTVTVGEVWRRQHLSCPPRHELGSFLLGALDSAVHDYVRFHLEIIGCRTCQANLEDLKQSRSTAPDVLERRQRIFASSAGKLPRDGK
ncbi:MAG: hypothetical protein JWM11_4345 [Planctomycetaceae bacterium]|nr:hypothetical protein [Planctomycetaceae bacterium]